jgi:hypothetical protein
MKLAAPLGGIPSDTFHASTWSRGTLLAGKAGNTHVVPPKCRINRDLQMNLRPPGEIKA